MFIRPCFENNLSVTLMENETCCSSFFLAVQSITLWNHFYLGGGHCLWVAKDFLVHGHNFMVSKAKSIL